MNKITNIIFIVLTILLVSFFVFRKLNFYKSENKIKVSEESKNKNHILKVVTTTGMLGDAIKNIAKDKISVTVLMGPGVDPHSYKAAPKDLRELQKADVIIYNGLHLEGKMSKVFKELNKLKPTYAAGDAIEKSKIISDDDFSEGVDPHIWFDVSLWKKVVAYIRDILIKHDPINASEYRLNSDRYISKLDHLHTFILENIIKIPESQRILITAHDAFGYFGRAYGLEVKGLQGISTASDYGLKDIISLINIIISKKIKAIFLETSVAEKPIRAVIEGCKERNHIVVLGGPLYSDAIGEKGTEEGTYIGMLRANINTIVKGLKIGIK